MTENEVSMEIARVRQSVQNLLESRRARKRAEGEQCVARSLEKRYEKYKLGQLTMCSCDRCIRAYILRSGPDHMCERGSHEFWRDTWMPWVP
jgi:hypothetical protein